MANLTPEFIARTPEGRLVVSGEFVFRFHDQEGLPLEVVVDLIDRQKWVVDWIGWWSMAMKSGWKPARAWNKAVSAWDDVYGSDYRATLEARFREALWVREAYRQGGIEPYASQPVLDFPPGPLPATPGSEME